MPSTLINRVNHEKVEVHLTPKSSPQISTNKKMLGGICHSTYCKSNCGKSLELIYRGVNNLYQSTFARKLQDHIIMLKLRPSGLIRALPRSKITHCVKVLFRSKEEKRIFFFTFIYCNF